MKLEFINKPYVVLDYQISHSQLLLRNTTGIRNTDVIFYGVTYVSIPFYFKELKISELPKEEATTLNEKLGLDVNLHTYFNLECEGKNHIIGAGRIEVYQNNFEQNTSPISKDDNKGELIDLLIHTETR